MSNKTIVEVFNEVAVAIQEKTGKTASIAAKDFGDQIRAIEAKSNTKVREGLRFSTSNLCVHLDKLLEYLPDEVKSLHVRSTDYSGSAFSFACNFFCSSSFRSADSERGGYKHKNSVFVLGFTGAFCGE